MAEHSVEEREQRSSADHRKHLRKPLIILRVKLEDDGKAFFGYAKNISRSGFFIGTVNPYEAGDVFDVELKLPEPVGENVQCRAQVVWRRTYARNSPYEPGMGLKFLDLPEEIAEAIDDWARS